MLMNLEPHAYRATLRGDKSHHGHCSRGTSVAQIEASIRGWLISQRAAGPMYVFTVGPYFEDFLARELPAFAKPTLLRKATAWQAARRARMNANEITFFL